MRNLLFLFLIFFSTAFASAPEDCPTFDFSSRFGPTRDQGGHGLCWAFTAAALFEEQSCLQNPRMCGESFSPLDVSRCQWRIGQEQEGSHVFEALECGLSKEGICREQDSPFYENFSFACLGGSIASGNSDFITQCTTQGLIEFYKRWKNELSEKEVCEYHQSPLELNQEFPKIIKILGQYQNLTSGRDAQGFDIKVDPLKSLLEAKNEWDFLKLVLIPKTCQDNRIKFKGQVINMINSSYVDIKNDPASNAKKWHSQVLFALRQNRSVGISLYTDIIGKRNKALDKFFKICVSPDKCGAHALVVNGMRWNASAKSCEIHLKNSWGEAAPYHGWVNAEDIFRATYSGTYLK